LGRLFQVVGIIDVKHSPNAAVDFATDVEICLIRKRQLFIKLMELDYFGTNILTEIQSRMVFFIPEQFNHLDFVSIFVQFKSYNFVPLIVVTLRTDYYLLLSNFFWTTAIVVSLIRGLPDGGLKFMDPVSLNFSSIW
jgi:hypothetical protein